MRTSALIDRIIRDARVEGRKAICFVTGVPGAGKTLVGLDVATKHRDKNALHSVFLSGNGPLVAVLREALARDHVQRELSGVLAKYQDVFPRISPRYCVARRRHRRAMASPRALSRVEIHRKSCPAI